MSEVWARLRVGRAEVGTGVVAGALAVALLGFTVPTTTEPSTPPAVSASVPASSSPAPTPLFHLQDGEIDEASGMARSFRHDDVWWVTNDSGDGARIFAVDAAGATLGTVDYTEPVRDVEAMAAAPGPDGEGWLYVADIGDNLNRRDVLTVYRLPEPQPANGRVDADPFPLEYSDGPHDAEALAVHPESGRFVVVTKSSPGAIYATTGSPSVGVTTVLHRRAQGPVLATDAVFSDDGSTLFVRTLVSVIAYSWPDLTHRGTVPVPLRAPDGTPLQGETVALGGTTDTLLVGSEGEYSPVYEIATPTAEGAPTLNPDEQPPALPERDATVLGTVGPLLVGAVGVLAFGGLLVVISSRRRRRSRPAA